MTVICVTCYILCYKVLPCYAKAIDTRNCPSGRSPDLFDGAGKFGPTYDCYGHIIADLVAGRACAHTCLSMCAYMPKTWYVLQGLGDRPTRPQRLRKLGHFRTQANFWFPLSSLKLQLSLNLSPCLPSGLYCLLPKNQLPLGRFVFISICLCVLARNESRHQTSVLCWTYLSWYNAKVQWYFTDH